MNSANGKGVAESGVVLVPVRGSGGRPTAIRPFVFVPFVWFTSAAVARLNGLPLGPGEHQRAKQIELAGRFYANGWLALGQGVRLAGLVQFASGVALG